MQGPVSLEVLAMEICHPFTFYYGMIFILYFVCADTLKLNWDIVFILM